MKVPNADTIKAIKELNRGKGKRFNDAEELFRGLGIQKTNADPASVEMQVKASVVRRLKPLVTAPL